MLRGACIFGSQRTGLRLLGVKPSSVHLALEKADATPPERGAYSVRGKVVGCWSRCRSGAVCVGRVGRSAGLKSYAAKRNDALEPHAVSRMSGYLNVGMVSPMRIAREANAASGAGKSKFLHEFLTWRGLAYAHFYHFPMPSTGATLEQLPSWAQDLVGRECLQGGVCSRSPSRWALSQVGSCGFGRAARRW